MNPWDYGMLLLAAYLVGALPTGYLFGRIARGVDVRAYGSGSTGATNVLRVLGRTAAALVFVGDFTKGFGAVWAVGALGLGPLAQALAGLAVLAGHNWPVFLGFKGGRGVASGVGALFSMLPLVAAVILAVALALMAATRYVSLGSVMGTLLAVPLSLYAVAQAGAPVAYLAYVLPGAALIVLRHHGNIRRLLQGTERKLGESVPLDRAAGRAPARAKRRAHQRRAPVG